MPMVRGSLCSPTPAAQIQGLLGACPQTPGCIPILVLAAVIPNHQSWLCFITILVLPELYPNHQSCLSSILISVFAAFLICPSLLSIHLFTSAHPFTSIHLFTSVHLFMSVHLFPLFTCSHLSICSIYLSLLSVYPFCLSTCSHLSQFHLSICSCLSACSAHPSVHICLSVHIHSSLPVFILLSFLH